MDDTTLRNKIADVLNEYQYRYLYISEKYWWNAVSPDHFVNMELGSASRRGFSSNWGSSRGNIPKIKVDNDVVSTFSTFVMEDGDLPIQFIFLIDAKKDHLNGEYHLMYIEIVIAFEHLKKGFSERFLTPMKRKCLKKGRLKGKFLIFYISIIDGKMKLLKILLRSATEEIR